MAVDNGSGSKPSIRAVRTIQCSACGCGWYVGEDVRNQPRAAQIILRGYGLQVVPDCSGCPCHTGIGVLPFLKVTMNE